MTKRIIRLSWDVLKVFFLFFWWLGYIAAILIVDGFTRLQGIREKEDA